MKRIITTLLLSLLAMSFCLAAENTYDLFINGKKVQVTDTPEYSFTYAHQATPFTVCLKGLDETLSVDVSPHAKGVKSERKGKEASFTISKQGYYIVTIGQKGKLFIFAEDALKTPAGKSVLSFEGIKADGKTNITKVLQAAVDAAAGNTLVFPKGVYLTSGLCLPSNSDIFLEEGAVIRCDAADFPFDESITQGFIEINNAENVCVKGQGIIDGNAHLIPQERRLRRNVYANHSKNVLLEGLISFNSARWNSHFIWCDNVVCKDYKIMSNWSIKNTDGFDPDCSKNISIIDCFAHCSDDCVAIKSTDRAGAPRNVENITIKGCVFETKKSALKVGTETLAEEMFNILFEDNDVVESDRGMSLYVKDGTAIHDVVYRNNRFERNYPDVCRYPYHFYVVKRDNNSKVGSIYNALIEDCVYEQAFPNEPCIENPYGTRLDYTIKGLVLPKASDSINILIFGHSYGRDCTEYLPSLAVNAGMGNVRVGRFIKANCSLEEHYNYFLADTTGKYSECLPGQTKYKVVKKSVREALAERKWDYVIFQNSLENEGRYNTAQPFLDNLVKVVRDTQKSKFGNEPVICWNMFWPISKLHEDGSNKTSKYRLSFYGNSSEQMWTAYMGATKKLMKETGINFVIPSGTAVMNIRASKYNTPDENEFTKDGYHMSSTNGRYLVACVFYEKLLAPLSGKSVVGNSFRVSRKGTALISDEMAGVLQRCAATAVKQPFKLSRIPEK